MRTSKTLAFLLLTVLTVNVSQAANGKAQKKANTNPKTKLETSFKFDGSALRGKYQSSLSTTATVENDKFLEDLLGGRTQFEDRAQKDLQRN